MIDNILFGKEIKGLNFLNNPNYKYEIMDEKKTDSLTVAAIRAIVSEKIQQDKDLFKENIRYITNPVAELFDKNRVKVKEILGDVRSKRGVYCGINIQKLTNLGINTITRTSYVHLDMQNTKEMFYMSYVEGNGMSALFAIAYYDKVLDKTICYNPVYHSPAQQLIVHAQDHEKVVAATYNMMDLEVELMYMVSHMSIDPIILGPRAKLHEQACKYENHTNNSIEIIKSNYLYDLHKSGAFKVSGHFRWQPCKVNGVETKKLIFISDFVKEGYTTRLRTTAI